MRDAFFRKHCLDQCLSYVFIFCTTPAKILKLYDSILINTLKSQLHLLMKGSVNAHNWNWWAISSVGLQPAPSPWAGYFLWEVKAGPVIWETVLADKGSCFLPLWLHCDQVYMPKTSQVCLEWLHVSPLQRPFSRSESKMNCLGARNGSSSGHQLDTPISTSFIITLWICSFEEVEA